MVSNLNHVNIDSDEGSIEEDLDNYKGVHHQQESIKYFCPVTGAHFSAADLRNKL